MKKIVALLFVMACVCEAEAKYNAPAGIVSRSDKIANWQLDELDSDKDGKLSLDEFKRKVDNYGRDERRNVRRAKKEGFYMSPEQQFKAADADEDGFLSDAELAEFIRAQRDNNQGIYY